MSAWEIAPNVFCSTHIDPTAVPAALQHSKLTEAITSKFSMCIYKAHSLLSTAQPQRVWRGIIYITPTGADLTYTGGGAVCGADSAWRTWRLTPSPTPGQASSLANKSQDRYGARLENLASEQKAEETKKFFLHLSLLFTVREISKELVLRTSSPKYRQREQVREPATYLFRDSLYHNAFYYHSTWLSSIPSHVHISRGLASHSLSAKSGLLPVFVQPVC